MKEIRDALRILREGIAPLQEAAATSDAATLREITARVGRVLAAVHEDDTRTVDNVLRKSGYRSEGVLEILRDQVAVEYNGAIALVKFDAVIEAETGPTVQSCTVTVDGGSANIKLGSALYHSDTDARNNYNW